MQLSFEATLIEILRQALVDNAKVIELGGHQFPLRSTPKSGLRQGLCEGGSRRPRSGKFAEFA
jgi:hypothetical protein